MTDQEWTDFSPAWEAYDTVRNPERKWYQFWKPRYVLRKKEPVRSQYRRKGKIVEVRIDIEPNAKP